MFNVTTSAAATCGSTFTLYGWANAVNSNGNPTGDSAARDTLTVTITCPTGAVCASPGVCASGNCVDGFCCSTACTGDCDACSAALTASFNGNCAPKNLGLEGSPTACGAYRCNGSSTSCPVSCAIGGSAACDPTRYCTAANICALKQVNGQACTSAASCLSGNCVDGFCCDSACTGQCQACNRAGLTGSCGPSVGAPVGSRPACTSDGTSCAGACNGSGTTCVYPDAGVACRAGQCDAGVAWVAAGCNGSGSCPPSQMQPCAPYACGVGACQGNCTDDLQCSSATWCAAGLCVAKLAQGAACATPSQCAGNRCVDGVCCDTACNGQCEACDLPTLAGTCSVVKSGPPHSGRPACSGMGACVGTCNGSSPTVCSSAVATNETCNGIDDNCNGVVDEGVCLDGGGGGAGGEPARGCGCAASPGGFALWALVLLIGRGRLGARRRRMYPD